MTKAEVKQRLIDGNKRFIADKLDGKLQDTARRTELTKGQQPYAIVLSCADSRVVPELAFDAGLGELFVVRVAGNIANTASVASIEYAVAHCGSIAIVVLGHQSCGAVTAAMAGGDHGSSLAYLLENIQPAIKASGPGAPVNDVVKTNAKVTAEELVNCSSIIGDAVRSGKVDILPAYYNLDSGRVDFL